jgi:hypothetical protein
MVSLAAGKTSPIGGPESLVILESRFKDNCTFFRCIGMESKLTSTSHKVLEVIRKPLSRKVNGSDFRVVYCLCFGNTVMTIPNQVWGFH